VKEREERDGTGKYPHDENGDPIHWWEYVSPRWLVWHRVVGPTKPTSEHSPNIQGLH
jgi:hypothetical protein